MTLRRAMIVGVRTVHEFVSNRCREDVRTRKRRVHGTGCEAGLGEGVSAVVRRVIVTVVVVLTSRYIPPSGLVRGRAVTGARPRPRYEVRPEGTLTDVPKPLGLRLQEFDEVPLFIQSPQEPGAAKDEVFEALVGCAVCQPGAEQVAACHPKRWRKRLHRFVADLLDYQTTVAQYRFGRQT